ncbi:FecR domain-containing protein [Calycomorphotria hydatis]|uniref:FecR protein n=1 Tax=Calycomorphotria hydatis TaxID=2528027 RepID=A0A517TAM7_9PLAN|nr:FecR family protein [Calycomorphotria hydatis]QDT65424.1 FecR protein [Calycomorphotria hydatis]
MSNSSGATRNEIIQLAELMCSGHIDQAGTTRLESLLKLDVRHRQWYVEYLDANATLIRRGSRIEPEATIESILNTQAKRAVYSRRWRWIAAGVMGASASVAAVIMLIMVARAPLPAIGHLTLITDDAEWGIREILPGETIRQAQPLVLNQGRARVELFNDVQLDLISPVAVTVSQLERIALLSGAVSVTVSEKGHGFTVKTADADIVDLGTQFLVDRTENEGTRVIVKKGRVQAKLLDDEGIALHVLDLTTGRSALLSSQNQSAEEVDPQTGFPNLMQKWSNVNSGIHQSHGDIRLSPRQPTVFTEGIHPTDGFILVVPENQQTRLEPAMFKQLNSSAIDSALNQTVDSYLIHFDPPSSAASGALGTVTFNQPILCVLMKSDELKQTDAIFAAPGTSWSTDINRGFEEDEPVTISDDRRTLTLHPSISGTNLLDQCRVLVQCEPSE